MKSPVHPLIKTVCLLGLAITGGLECLHAEEPKSNEASIRTPGPDLANFPNSAFTLPQGRAYVELAPLNYTRRSAGGSPTQWSAGYLLRYGVTDDFELRLLSDGYTNVRGSDGPSGMAPQTFDFKWHFCDENKDSHLPAFGVEVAVQTDIASRAFREGTQPALSLNFDQTLPLDIAGRPEDVAPISSMMFGVGYMIAAVSPVGLGLIRDVTGSFQGSIAALAVVAAAILVATPLFSPRRLSPSAESGASGSAG